ncbi:MAG: membrane dipeptidase, partial [Anaerolineales bacterium]|nr:membrane dipeptidase [Anaerolineales bacterium]
MNSEILKDGIIFDAHCDTLIQAPGKRGLAERCLGSQVDLPRLIEGGVTAQVFAICLRKFSPPVATKRALYILDYFYSELAKNKDQLCLATRVAHIEEAYARGQVAALLSFESVEPLQGDLALCRMFYRLGLRCIGLTHNQRNMAADGVYEQRTGGGLSTYGVALVEEMNRLGMVIDVSHLAPCGLEDVLEISQAPVIASHTGMAAICNHPRNLSDAQIEAIARQGGVVCVFFVPYYLEPDGSKQSSVNRALDHI